MLKLKNIFEEIEPSNIIKTVIDGISVPILVVSKRELPEGKNDVTEYSSDNNLIRVRSDYDYKKDPIGWVRHELVHYLYDLYKINDDKKIYPENKLEIDAYSNQFKYLYKHGYNTIQLIDTVIPYKRWPKGFIERIFERSKTFDISKVK